MSSSQMAEVKNLFCVELARVCPDGFAVDLPLVVELAWIRELSLVDMDALEALILIQGPAPSVERLEFELVNRAVPSTDEGRLSDSLAAFLAESPQTLDRAEIQEAVLRAGIPSFDTTTETFQDYRDPGYARSRAAEVAKSLCRARPHMIVALAAALRTWYAAQQSLQQDESSGSSRETPAKKRRLIVRRLMKRPSDFTDPEKLSALIDELDSSRIPLPRRQSGAARFGTYRELSAKGGSAWRRVLPILRRDLYDKPSPRGTS